MKRMTPRALKQLENIQSNIQITMYLPTEPGPEGTAKNISTLHHAAALLKKAQVDAGTPKAARGIVAGHIKDLEQQLSHPMPGKSLAIFITEWNDIIAYIVPFEVETAIYFMAPNVQLEPLWQYYRTRSSYWVLALSQRGCQLFRGFGDTLKHVEASDIGVDMKTALGLDETDDPAVQSHTVASGSRRTSEGFHGHGRFKDMRKKYLENYLRYVDKRLGRHMGRKIAPIYLIGVQQSQDMFKRVSAHRQLQKTPLHTIRDLHDLSVVRRLSKPINV